MEIEFAHEKLEVWKLAVELADYGLSLSEEISKRNKLSRSHYQPQ
jgi:hypothetical protein